MFKKIFIPILLLFLYSCGYEAIHSKKNSIKYDFSISKLLFIGDRNVNKKIKEILNHYTINEKDKNFTLKISSDTEKVVLAKDYAGDPTSFKFTIKISVEIIMKNNFKDKLNIVESFNYNNNTNKFNLKEYEREIINNLAERVAEKLIYKLSNI
jgi:outer membrane lipopolysaccharide assembly protein LptE/RlpB